MHVTLIYNAGAGSEDHSLPDLVHSLERHGNTVRAQEKDDKDFPQSLFERADLVAVAGGDGTVAEVLRKLRERNTPVAILPLGTANNIARSLGIWGGPERLIRNWPNARTQKLDLFAVEGPWGVHLMVESLGAGRFSEILSRLHRSGSKSDGLQAARQALSQYMKNASAFQLRIDADGQSLSGDFISVEILNLPMFGPALPVLPHAQLGRGILEIALFTPDRREAMAEWIEAPERAGCPVRAVKARTAKFAWTGFALRLDDEFPDPPEKAATVSVRKSGDQATILV
jgi:diacylglycerol kinase (ATP)